MGGKAKSRSHFCMLKVKKIRYSYLNVMKFENYGPKGECLNNKSLNLTKEAFLCFLQ